MLDAQVNIRLTSEEKAAFQQAAAACGLNMPTWLRLVARQSAGLRSVVQTTAVQRDPELEVYGPPPGGWR